jgi:transcriptional regulator with XRE-family HTH domain
MDTSPTSFLSEILEGIEGSEIPKHKLAYFRARLRNRIYDLVISEFAKLQEEKGVSKADLANRIGRDAAQISRWLSAPSNWTLDTISDLLIAMRAELQLGVQVVGAQVQSSEPHLAAKTRTISVADEIFWEFKTKQENEPQKSPFDFNPQILVNTHQQAQL